MNVVLVTMDTHLSSAMARATTQLARELPGLSLRVHAASEWSDRPEALARCVADIEAGDIIVVTMLFLEDHFQAVLPALKARREACDAMVCMMSAPEVSKLTRMGRFTMDGTSGGLMAMLRKLRGNAGKPQAGKPASAGAQQMKMLRRIPQLLRFVPGTAQDVRAYFLTLQYWLGGSEENVLNLVRALVDRYADGPRRGLRGTLKPQPPVEYPEVGLYHPRMKGRISDSLDALPRLQGEGLPKGRVGLLVMRSYLLAGNAQHYDGVIAAMEVEGLQVVPAFASGLDQRPAIEQFFTKDGVATVDAVVSLTGFSLVGGPAYNDSRAAEETLAKLDVPYVAAHPVEFQTLDQWGASERGLLPVESTIMVAIPELDGATAPTVFGGRGGAPGTTCTGCSKRCTFDAGEDSRDMRTCSERVSKLAARVGKMIALRRSERAQRRVAIVLFDYPPASGNAGTAACLGVFESLFNTLSAMKAAGYTVDVPADVEALRRAVLEGNAQQYGTPANVCAKVAADDHVRRETWLREIEAQWGPAPGRIQTDGRSIFVMGERFGNVVVGVQPGMGYEGDPMRLLFERGFAPTHAFSAFYRWIGEDFAAHAVLHFGTHGALEFMPGKQAGMTGDCWPDRMIGTLPNLYLYASNNPSEGTIAKRRAGATLISYLTPPISGAGLYRGLLELKESVDRWRTMEPDEAASTRAGLAAAIQAQAAELEMADAEPAWTADDADAQVRRLHLKLMELETTLIPNGLHVVGRALTDAQRTDMLGSMAESGIDVPVPPRAAIEALAAGATPEQAANVAGVQGDAAVVARLGQLADAHRLLKADTELAGILHALDGRWLRPAPGGDLLRNPSVLPTGRNLHGFDPFRIPSAWACRDGAAQAAKLLERHAQEHDELPESIAIVLWGTDNLKTEGGPIAQALALMGAKPRFDSYGRLAGATLVPLAELGRPRIDVLITLSGIFRDLMPLQIKLLAEAAFLAASADEPAESNFIRKHALAYMAEHGCDLETAALRVYGNADGAYGSNVNMMIENGRWDDEDELAEAYTRRKGFAYGRAGRPTKQPALLQSQLADVKLTFQNLDSVELGVTTVDTYFDTLGGISRAVRRAKGGEDIPVYIGDQTKGDGTIRTLSEQVALESRTRMLNPKWYEGMLSHGYEGVRQIEVHLTNTMGWSATTGQVQPWVYQQLTETFMLDPEMRERLAKLNPTASAKVASRLLEASARNYWTPDEATLEALRRAGEELEDRLEGITEGSAA
ncbi:MAG: magnesium chelatase subunit H [Burkholderiales bacterium]